MSAAVVEFFSFQMPFAITVLAATIQKFTGNLTMVTEISAGAFALWYVDIIINPLWTTFIAKKQQQQPKQNQVSQVPFKNISTKSSVNL